ncbi:MAG TPA: DUF885 domain-containing protein [Nitrolancea sp.]|nr:DUF885 domain-containing protein [Nitrolancea sp.]
MNDMSQFDTLVGSILDDFYASRPTEARWLGLHQYDGLIGDHSPAGLAKRHERLHDQITALESFPSDNMTDDEAFDRDLLLSQLQFELFQLAELRERARNPIVWSDDIDLSGYLLRAYAPIDQRALALKQQAALIPTVLANARAVLDSELSRPIVETAIEVFKGVAGFLRDDVRPALNEAGTTVSVENEIAEALTAVDHFIEMLEERLDQANAEFAIGPDLLRKLVRYGELVDIDLDDLLDVGERDLERNLALARETAAMIDPSRSVAEVVLAEGRDHPPADQLIQEVSAVLENLRQFILDHDIVSIPSTARCIVRETPNFLRWASAMMDTAGAYEDESVESYYFVTPPEPEWDAERTEEWLTNFERSGLAGLSIHEAYPGHFVHFQHVRNVASPVRRMVLSYSFVEGWAHYVEEMMLEEGFGNGDQRHRLSQLKGALLRNCRLVASIRMHAHGMTVDEATEFFMKNGFLEEAPARSEAVRGTFDPGYLNYTFGLLMMRKLRADVQAQEGDRFSLRDFHDRMLALGAPPFALARRVLTPGNLTVI